MVLLNFRRVSAVLAVIVIPALFGIVLPRIAHSQEASPSRALLEEIVVTARRRDESIQDVPISISAFSAEALQRRQVLTTMDLDNVTPSMQFTSYGQLSGNNSAAVVFIRGVGQLDPTPAVDPGVGIYLDDVYLGRSVGGAMDFFDLSGVQVLRGPQGTLFGRNTIGGAVLIDTNLPGDRLEGTVQAAIGDDNLQQVFAALTVPLGDTVAARVSLGSRTRDGYVIREVDGLDLGDDDVLVAKGTLKWTPSNDVDFILRGDYTKEDENGSPFVFKGINTSAPVPAIVSVAAGCPGATIPFAPLAPGDPQFGAPFVPEVDDPRCANSYYDQGPFTNGGVAPVESSLESSGVSATLIWNMSDALELRSITASRSIEWTGIRDADNTPFVILTTDYTSESDQFSQEFRLRYAGDSVVGVLGAYYFDEDTSDRVTVPLSFPPAPPVIASLLGGGPGTRDLQYIDLSTESIAVFTEWTFEVSQRLDLTAGLRYTEDDKGFRGTVMNLFPWTDPDPDPLPTTAIPDGGPLFIYPDWFEDTYQKTTGSASLRYRFSDAAMGYISYSQSFKSGGFNQRYNAPPPGFVPLSFDEETVESFEVGMKADFTDSLRVNAAAFFSTYDDIQFIYRQGVVPLLFNAGKASIDGFELEFTYAPNNRFLLEGGVSFLDDSIDDITDVPGADATVGPDNSLPFTPEWQVNLGAGYTFNLSPTWSLTPRIDASYTDEQYFDAGNTEIVAQLDPVTIVNLMIALTNEVPDGGNWRFELAVRNLTDELYPLMGNASLATLGYAEMIYARERNAVFTVRYDF